MTRTIKSSPRRKHQTPPEQLREQIEAKLKTELSNKQHNKLLAVKMVLNGFPPSKISDVFGVHANTITAWVRKADTVGIDALLKPRAKTGGRTSALSKDNLKEIESIIEENNPMAYGVDIWDAPRLASFIQNRYGVPCGRENARQILHKLGFSYRAPRLLPSKNREGLKEKQADFSSRMAEYLTRKEVIPVFQDEVHFRVATDIGRGWFKQGHRPTVASSATRKSKKTSGFFLPHVGELYTTDPDWFQWDQVIASFRQFAEIRPLEDGKKYLIILDNASWHVKAVNMINILPEYADLREKMEFLFLPPYSPELNPIERVWHRLKYLKRNREFKNINELEAWLEKVFEEARQTYGFLYGIGLTDINVAA